MDHSCINESLLRAPCANETTLQPPIEKAEESTNIPFVTWMLMAVLAAIFVAEQLYAIEPSTEFLSPSIRTLLALGGLFQPLVFQAGEWYRIFTATLLHGDAMHLLVNGVALYFAGTILESFIGRAWFLVLFFVGAVGGSLMSLAVNPATIVSVGASGAIMGLFAGAYVCSYQLPSDDRTPLQMGLLRVLIPSLIPLTASGTEHIDFGAHIGGALSGGAAGFAMLKIWNPTSPLPGFIGFARIFSVIGILIFALAFVPIVQHHHQYVLGGLLIPDHELPTSNAEAKSRSLEIVTQYPRDPRARLFRAIDLLEAEDLVGAEREIRAALAEEEILKNHLSPELESDLREILQYILFTKDQPVRLQPPFKLL